MKYNPNFIRDVKFYYTNRKRFNFDGVGEYVNKSGSPVIVEDIHGVDGVKAFYIYDSQGKILPTKHPNLLHSLLKTKGSVNLHIKMYAEDIAKCYLPKIEFDKMAKQINAPDWFTDAVDRQRWKYC